jgi:hypothetical protein
MKSLLFFISIISATALVTPTEAEPCRGVLIMGTAGGIAASSVTSIVGRPSKEWVDFAERTLGTGSR